MELLLALILYPIDSPVSLYAILFGMLLLSGIGLPVPEEVSLLLGGYLAYLGFLNYWTTVYVIVAGIISADLAGYALGRFAGARLHALMFERWEFAKKLIEKGKVSFDRHGEKVVMFSRPLLGVRAIVPILAGHFRMNIKKFILYDIIAAIPWTLLLVSLSYYLGSGLVLISEFRTIKHALVMAIGIGILGFFAIKIFRKHKTKASKHIMRP